MEFLERIWATLEGGTPDMVPYAPYDNLVPRGSFERSLRNLGMGLCARRSGIWSESPNVRVERRTEGNILRTIYHTPKGQVSTAYTTRHDRLSDSGSVQIEWLIKEPADFEPVIFMIEDTVHHRDDAFEANVVRDFGDDGIVRGAAVHPPYDSSENYFGLANWIYFQRDYPEQFARLLDALERREARLFPLAAESKLKFVGFGSVSGSYSPADYAKYTLPFYQKYVPLFAERGKICAIHAHASNLVVYEDMIKDTGCPVVEAFTPPPVGDLPIAEARRVLGPDTVIWVNFPETVFYDGKDAVARYTRDLIESDPQRNRLVIGFTEMGLFGITDAYTEKAFKDGFLAIAETINEYGRVG
ncbi:MAG TPA: hypothetical protein VF960_14345 [Chloroflexota bacterium]